MPRAGLTAESVVAGAAHIADTSGLEALSLAALAERLGVRAPSLYKHVGGLPDLHRRLTLDGLRGLREVLRDAVTGVAGPDALRALGHAHRAYALAYPGRYAAAQRAPDGGDAEVLAAAAAVTEVLLAVLRGAGLEGDDLVHAARTVRSALHGFVALEMTAGFGLPQDLNTSYEHLLDVLETVLHSSSLRGSSR